MRDLPIVLFCLPLLPLALIAGGVEIVRQARREARTERKGDA